MKVDFHIHTPDSISNGDSIKWESTMKTLKILNANNVKAFAFTDHNVFSTERYFEAKKILKNKIIIFPGIEINIKKDNGIIGHVLFIFNNDIDDESINNLELIANKNLRKHGLKIDEVFGLFKDYEKIIIPHVGKGDFFTPDELTFDIDAIEITNINHHNYKKWLSKNNDKSVVAFSDTHIWRDYPQNNNLETRIDFDGSFKSLKEKLNKNKNYTKEI